ncbi:MAG: FG-GAP-like repeat-containing protein, partial [Fimbriiglobus sp.]
TGATVTLDPASPVNVFNNPDPNATSAQAVFGFRTGFVEVDPLGRYMSADGRSFAVISAINPNTISTSNAVAPAGTVDAYLIRFSTVDSTTPELVLMSSVPGQSGQSSGDRVFSAIVPADAPNTIVFAAITDADSQLVPGYVSNNGNQAELYVRSTAGNSVNGGVLLGPTFLVTAALGTTNQGANGLLDLSNGSYAVSPDGTKVAYGSSATNLVGGVTYAKLEGDFTPQNVFVRNLAAGTAQVVSITSTGIVTGNGASFGPRFSNDGGLVAFASAANNLVTIADTNGALDVFVRDLTANRTGAVSTQGNGLATGNAGAFGVVIGGTKTAGTVFFNSTATNLDPQYTPNQIPSGSQQVFSTRLPFFTPNVNRGVGISGGRNGFAAVANAAPNGALTPNAPSTPFPGFTGEIRTATGDVTGDGIPDLLVGTGQGTPSRVKVIDGATGKTAFDAAVFEAGFTGGVYVSAGDLTGDGVADILVGAGEGGGPRVVVINGMTRGRVSDTFVFESSFRGGVRVAAGDVNGDGRTDLVAAAGEGGGPRVSVFSGRDPSLGTVLANFFAFEQRLRNGVYVGAGDMDGDGRADVIAGAGPGGAPRVSVFTAQQMLTPILGEPDRLFNFYAFPETQRDGVRVAIKNITADGTAGIVVGAGGGAPQVRTFNPASLSAPGAPQLVSDTFAFDDTVGTFGAWVG